MATVKSKTKPRTEREDQLAESIGRAANTERLKAVRRKLKDLDDRGFGRPAYNLESPYGSGQYRCDAD